MQSRPFSAVITAVLAILAGFFFQNKHNDDLAAARAETQVAIEYAVTAAEVTLAALQYGDSVTRVADSALALAAEANRRATQIRQSAVLKSADSAAAVAPDTCAPALALAQLARHTEHDAAESWKEAYELSLLAAAGLRSGLDSVVPAAEGLVAATDHLSDAAGTLVEASKPSWLARLKPDIGIGATVGIDPETRGFSKTVGVTVSWRIL